MIRSDRIVFRAGPETVAPDHDPGPSPGSRGSLGGPPCSSPAAAASGVRDGSPPSRGRREGGKCFRRPPPLPLVVDGQPRTLPPTSSPRTTIRGPALVLAAASAVRPVLHRLRRHREPRMGPRLRGDDERGRKPARQGRQARRRLAGTGCVHTPACSSQAPPSLAGESGWGSSPRDGRGYNDRSVSTRPDRALEWRP